MECHLDWDKIEAAYREMDDDGTLPGYHSWYKHPEPPVPEEEKQNKRGEQCGLCRSDICAGLDTVDWIACDGRECGRWYHVPCLGNVQLPEVCGLTFCPSDAAMEADQRDNLQMRNGFVIC